MQMFRYALSTVNVVLLYDKMSPAGGVTIQQTRHFVIGYKPKVRLTISINSLNSAGVNKWNQLPTVIKLNSTLSCFKSFCRKYLFQNL